MNHKISAQEKFYQLRKQAEIFMVDYDFTSTLTDMDDPLKLIHELQTFQIELELQNEELKRSQQELMETQIKYTQLYDFAPVGYLTVDFNGMIINANLALAEMLLVERSSLINQMLSVHIVSEDQDIYYQHLRELSVSKARQICELRMKNEEEKIFDVQLESTVVSISQPTRARGLEFQQPDAGGLPQDDHPGQDQAGCNRIERPVIVFRQAVGQSGAQAPAHHTAVLDEEQSGENGIPAGRPNSGKVQINDRPGAGE